MNGRAKTHLALGLALAACRQGRKVHFWTAAGLVNELQQAQDEHRLGRFSTTALKLDLLVLDELGFIPFSPAAAQLLFTFYSELHERVAVIVTSNLKFADWNQIFGQERLTAALLDRLTQKAHIMMFRRRSISVQNSRSEKNTSLPCPDTLCTVKKSKFSAVSALLPIRAA